jgi:hypothetical protein
MFDHDDIEKYEIHEVPLNRDLFLMDDKWIVPYEHSLLTLLNGGEYEQVGYIAYAAVRTAGPQGLEISCILTFTIVSMRCACFCRRLLS